MDLVYKEHKIVIESHDFNTAGILYKCLTFSKNEDEEFYMSRTISKFRFMIFRRSEKKISDECMKAKNELIELAKYHIDKVYEIKKA